VKKWYYILFLIGLYLFNQTFQEFIVVNGIISGLIAGLIIAFVCKLIFSALTKTFIVLAIGGGILVFLVSVGYLEIPAFLQGIFKF